MSVRSTVRAFPTMLRIGFSEAVAYRAELFIWVLSTTMPFVMMALWTEVARVSPVGRFGGKDFVGYFLATFVVRQLTGAWAAWQMNFEVRQGTLAMRLLRPVSPLWAYAAENLAAVPLRLIVAVPVLLFSVFAVGGRAVPAHAWGWGLFLVALLGGWLITFFANVAIGTLALYMESSTKVMDVWLALFFVLSGYLYPLEVFPTPLRVLADWLPFRYQIGLPVELLTGAHGFGESAALLARQWLWVALMAGLCTVLWRRGLKRFAAYGG
ncbi:ABC transporter permease [Aggregicoccus sp. 17bor-14]|uniref:ABC transporter permease n=1 Tax=Myxococcaceae TaxID=31 RepID=UPI00129C4318|nr:MULTISPECIES: ABC-2 family transporter protein [Myxococcaceae]MBF5042103.1 ABC-2 family transporter protein [Simulacricoccus sp. 17bor-14]MRI87880.1 ABC transporter permease [Aggregicoccus sp. 17bor-14]